MADSVKKQTGGATRYVFKFDAPPTMNELKNAINKVDLADRDTKIAKVANAGDVMTVAPVRFVFIVETEAEVDVP